MLFALGVGDTPYRDCVATVSPPWVLGIHPIGTVFLYSLIAKGTEAQSLIRLRSQRTDFVGLSVLAPPSGSCETSHY